MMYQKVQLSVLRCFEYLLTTFRLIIVRINSIHFYSQTIFAHSKYTRKQGKIINNCLQTYLNNRRVAEEMVIDDGTAEI
jgi:hypothetical protein